MTWAKENHSHMHTHTLKILRFHQEMWCQCSDQSTGFRRERLSVPVHSRPALRFSPRLLHHVCPSLQGRSHLSHEKEMFAQDHPEVNSLEEVVKLVKPTAIIGRRKGGPRLRPANPPNLQVEIEAQQGAEQPWNTALPTPQVQCNATNFH